ncbi:MAG: AAA family ATPase [Thiobacillus sp.]|nr:AAA family ATPase [Thiobacillus sp.]
MTTNPNQTPIENQNGFVLLFRFVPYFLMIVAVTSMFILAYKTSVLNGKPLLPLDVKNNASMVATVNAILLVLHVLANRLFESRWAYYACKISLYLCSVSLLTAVYYLIRGGAVTLGIGVPLALLAIALALMVIFTHSRFFETTPPRRAAMADGSMPSNADLHTDQFAMSKPKTGFAAILGMDELKARLLAAGNEVMASKGKKGARNGILLHGDPGNGKTAFAQALAGELKVKFLSISYSDTATMWVGEQSRKLKSAVEQAKRNAPCVFFIDEIDSFISQRSSEQNNRPESKDIVNLMLTELVELRNHKVLVMAATNLLESLDAAAIREGRFDFKIEVTPPDAKARLGLLRLGLQRNLPKATVDDQVAERVADRWNGFSVKRILAVTEELPSYLQRHQRPLGAPLGFDDFMGALRSVQGRKGVELEKVRPLSDLILGEELRDALDGIVARLQDPDGTERRGGTLPTGLLFYGPPGTGKTAVAKAMCKEVGWAFLTATGAELSRDPETLSKLYKNAMEIRPCLIFIDEADELLLSRQHSTHTASTNKLLSIMDGASDRVHDVVWIAATNHPEQIDSALLRGGRFTEKLEFELPQASAISAHIEKWLKTRSIRLDLSLSHGDIAHSLRDQSIANIEAVLQAAVNRAIGRKESTVSLQAIDIERAAKQVI